MPNRFLTVKEMKEREGLLLRKLIDRIRTASDSELTPEELSLKRIMNKIGRVAKKVKAAR